MAVEVILPRVDMDMATGKMGRWFVAEGERVAKGQLLFEIETDKAAMDIDAPAAGLLRGVCAQAGDILPVGSVVGWIVAPGEVFVVPVSAPQAGPTARASPAAAASQDEPTREAPGEGVRATPMARRLARECGAVLSEIVGSGPNGRVQARDIPARSGAFDLQARQRRAETPRQGGLHRLWLRQGEGAPLVFLHGFGADLNGWRPLLGHIRSRRPVLALDLPGHGQSPHSGEADLESLVEASAATLAQEQVSAAHLVGHSLGGAVASALAERRGFRALSLALIAPAGLGPAINGAFLAGFLQAGDEASLALWMRLLVTDAAALGPALVKTTLRQRAEAGVADAQRQIAQGLFPESAQAFSVRESLARLQCPAKIIFGGRDAIIAPDHAAGLPGLIAQHVFAGVGHLPHLEARREVARLIDELVAAGG